MTGKKLAVDSAFTSAEEVIKGPETRCYLQRQIPHRLRDSDLESWTKQRAEMASSIIKPLAHPYRLMIIKILVDGQERSAHTLARILGLSRAALFKHLYRLSECGLVSQDSTSRITRFSIPTDHLAAMVAIVAALSPISQLEGSIDLAAPGIEGLDRSFSDSKK